MRRGGPETGTTGIWNEVRGLMKKWEMGVRGAWVPESQPSFTVTRVSVG